MAVLAASGAAMAQSSVTLYGVADLWIGKVNKNDVAAGDDGLASSRLGFKGSEDLDAASPMVIYMWLQNILHL